MADTRRTTRAAQRLRAAWLDALAGLSAEKNGVWNRFRFLLVDGGWQKTYQVPN